MAELEDWTCEFNGLLMGAPDSAISIVQVDGLLTMPDVRSADLTLVQRHGLYPGDDYMNGRSVTLTLEVYGNTREEFTQALTDIQAAFMPGGPERPLKFRFPGVAADREAWVNVRPRKRSAPLNLDFAYMVCNVVVELYATSPYLNGLAPREVTAVSSVTEDVSGLVVPFTVPFTVRGTSHVEDPVARFTQYGSVPARPVIEFRNANNPMLVDDVTRDYFAISYSGSFTVDSANEVVTDPFGNDITALVTEGSTWPEYGPGAHRLRLVHGDKQTAATAALTWQDKWV